MRLTVLACALVTLALGATAKASAQEAATHAAPVAGPSAGPTWENATLGYQAETATGGDMTWDSARRSSRSTGKALAIVGGVLRDKIDARGGALAPSHPNSGAPRYLLVADAAPGVRPKAG